MTAERDGGVRVWVPLVERGERTGVVALNVPTLDEELLAECVRLGLFACGAALLLGYGSFVNLAPINFNQVVGLYIATLFIVWQVISFVAFRAVPNLPIVCGGALVIAGGLIITFWKPM